MSRDLPHTATDLLAWLRDERRAVSDLEATAGDNSHLAHGCREQRRVLERVIARVAGDLPAIEAEAVEAASRMDAWLEDGAGIPAGGAR